MRREDRLRGKGGGGERKRGLHFESKIYNKHVCYLIDNTPVGYLDNSVSYLSHCCVWNGVKILVLDCGGTPSLSLPLPHPSPSSFSLPFTHPPPPPSPSGHYIKTFNQHTP